jgi:hypothetical protein
VIFYHQIVRFTSDFYHQIVRFTSDFLSSNRPFYKRFLSPNRIDWLKRNQAAMFDAWCRIIESVSGLRL